MPAEIFDVENFIQLSEKAKYCDVKRLKDIVKLKIRSNDILYTFKIQPLEVEQILKKLKCEIKEV
jgi:hypothetical protein